MDFCNCNPSARRASRQTRLHIEQLEVRCLLAADPIINEFLASNAGVVLDEDGDSSDFIEIYNQGDMSLDLAGWYLTDDSQDLTQWQFPSVNLAAGEYLVVFASGKNRAVAGSDLHTSFGLSAGGEYLALVEPDGTTIASDFSPEYPLQFADISYGQAREATGPTNVLIATGAQATGFIPTDDSLGDTWHEPGFNDAGWSISGQTGFGYEDFPGATVNYTDEILTSIPSDTTSLYVRVPFSLTALELADIDELTLRMMYDDGFVAYINGEFAASANVLDPVNWNSVATTSHDDEIAQQLVPFDVSANIQHLEVGENTLAIQALNTGSGSSDMLIMPELTAQPPSIAVPGLFAYLDPPTPGSANGAGVSGFVAAPNASVAHGFYSSSFPVTLTTTTADADIYFTYDGSIPSSTNPAAMLYTDPITISSTTVLRTAAVKDEFGDSPVTTASYIFLDDVLQQDIDPNNPANNPFDLDYPAIWQTQAFGGEGPTNSPGDYEIDSRIDDSPLWNLSDALQAIPTMSIVLDHDDLWDQLNGIYPNATAEGDAWRRAGSIEYIDPTTGENFQYNVGVQMHGSASRDNERLLKHSFRLIFSSDWDGPSALQFPLFDNSEFADINTVVLRASFTDSFATRTSSNRYSPLDSTYTRDVFMRDTQLAMGHSSPDSTFVHLYINGLYWGMYSPAERTDDAFLASRLGGAREDWDIIRDFNELYQGSRGVYDDMFDLAAQIESASASVANDLFQELQGRNPDGTIDPNGTAYLDVDNFIDYILLHVHAGVEDWPSHNWVAARNRVDPGLGFKYFVWDQEIAYDGRFRDVTEATGGDGRPGELFQRLQNSSEFRLRFADRVQKHMFNHGALTVDANIARWLWRAEQVEDAIIGESARWGDAREGEFINVPPSTTAPLMTPTLWQNSIDEVVGYFPQSHTDALSRLANDGLWFTSVDAPEFSQFGGAVLPGFDLGMSTSTGGATIWYTIDGSDPRLLGGAINSSAISESVSGDLEINQTVTVKARTRTSSGSWSPLTEATFVVLQGSDGIVISEINYHPHDVTAAEAAAVPGVEEDDFEFIEIFNSHPTDAISLLNMSLANGLSFTFGNDSLVAGEYGLVVEDVASFEARYGLGHNILGEWSGGVSNSGETIELRDGLGELIMSVSYADENPWSEAPDGDGATLELVDPLATPAEELGKWYRWRASTEFGGSPGAAGVGPIGVVINEVLTHSNLPDSDAIELHNTTATPIDIGGWWLSDSGSSPMKFQIPLGTVLDAGAYVVYDEDDFNLISPPVGQVAFALSASSGDDVFLVISDGSGGVTSFVDSVHFGAAFVGETFGRVPNGSGRLTPLISNTLGEVNNAPRVGPLVISEVNYHPGPPSGAALAVDPMLTEQHLEFIEVYNRTKSTVLLTDIGIDGDASFGFAADSTLSAGETLVIVSFDPDAGANATRVEAFRAHYGIDGSVALVGPFSGPLSDSYARLELQIPDDPPLDQPALIPLVLSDEILYDDLAPWPTAADGAGSSLGRVSQTSYGNDGTSWFAATPSPGSADFDSGVPGDFDGDTFVTLADLDVLVAAVEMASGDLGFDLNGDNDVTVADIAFLIDDIVAPIAGDYNWDNVVDHADYGEWTLRFGNVLYLNVDGNGNGVADAADYIVWRVNLGNAGGSGAGAARADLSSPGGSVVASDEATSGSPLPIAVQALRSPIDDRDTLADGTAVTSDSALASLRYQGTSVSRARSVSLWRARAARNVPSHAANRLLAAADDRIRRSSSDVASVELLEHLLGEDQLADGARRATDLSKASHDGDAVCQAAAIDQAFAEMTRQ